VHELFTVLPPGEAFATLARDCSPIERSETVPLGLAFGRVLAEDVRAAETLPGFARAMMDGYAVRAADTHGASEQSPAYLKLVGDVPTGVVPDTAVGVREAVRIHTGAMMPPGADAVVMVEDTNLHGEGMSMATLAKMIQSVIRKPVVDATGIAGRFDFSVKYEEARAESLMEQLRERGFEFEAAKVATEYLVATRK
jgi:molybdopterin biosynthesis enzyme